MLGMQYNHQDIKPVVGAYPPRGIHAMMVYFDDWWDFSCRVFNDVAN